MKNIQKALKNQYIDAAWNGPDPDSIELITEEYLLEEFDGGVPRMVRSRDDAGNDIDFDKLRDDFIRLDSEDSARNHVIQIKNKAKSLIEKRYPDWKQRNMLARFLILTQKSNTEDLSEEESQELEYTIMAWEWIENIRRASNEAEITEQDLVDINWPE